MASVTDVLVANESLKLLARRRFLRAGPGIAALAALLSLGAPAAAQPAATPPPGAAQPQPGDKALGQAQALFVEGRAAMDRGDYPTACAQFTASLALMTRASTLLNLAQCETHEGQLVNAAKHVTQGIELLPADDERMAISKERAAALARRVAHLTVKLGKGMPATARVEIDGVDTSASTLLAGVAANPGKHVIVLSVPGEARQTSTIDLGEGDAKTVTLAAQEAAAVEAPKPVVATSNTRRTVGFLLGGIGVVGLVGAGVTGGILISKSSAINSACPLKQCSADGLALIESTKSLNVVNGVAWGVGLAGLAGGVVFLVLSRGDRAATAVAPTALAGGGGLQVTHSF
jgi:hypothetical protein